MTTSDRELSALVAEKIMGVEAQKVRAAGWGERFERREGMTDERMREALERAADFAESMRQIFADPYFTDRHDDAGRCERMRDYLREALSAPAPEARTEYEWIGSDETRYKVSATFGVLSLSYFHEWKGRFEGIDIDDADNVRAELAAAIATLAGLTKPGGT